MREWGLRSMALAPRRAHPERDDSEKATGKVEAMSMIVVGVDHSTEANAALRFALEEAQFRGARLLAVHAIDAFGTYPSLAVDVSALHRAAEELLETSLTTSTMGPAMSRSSAASSRARLGPPSSRNLAAPICSLSARAVTAASPDSCSGR
jgi:hypothetical protein